MSPFKNRFYEIRPCEAYLFDRGVIPGKHPFPVI